MAVVRKPSKLKATKCCNHMDSRHERIQVWKYVLVTWSHRRLTPTHVPHLKRPPSGVGSSKEAYISLRSSITVWILRPTPHNQPSNGPDIFAYVMIPSGPLHSSAPDFSALFSRSFFPFNRTHQTPIPQGTIEQRLLADHLRFRFAAVPRPCDTTATANNV